MINFASLPVVLALAAGADAFWRMPCHARTDLARIDPLMSPGGVSEHSHVIHGSGGTSAKPYEAEPKPVFAETNELDRLFSRRYL
jgi:hypothetical protein